MSYKKAEEILPLEVIELIQKYVDGQNIYIPKKTENRLAWGASTETKKELSIRNQMIYQDYLSGKTTAELAENYFLSQKSIQRIVYQAKKCEIL